MSSSSSSPDSFSKKRLFPSTNLDRPFFQPALSPALSPAHSEVERRSSNTNTNTSTSTSMQQSTLDNILCPSPNFNFSSNPLSARGLTYCPPASPSPSSSSYPPNEVDAARSLTSPTNRGCCSGGCSKKPKQLSSYSVGWLITSGYLHVVIAPVCNLNNISTGNHHHVSVSFCNTTQYNIPCLFKF